MYNIDEATPILSEYGMVERGRKIWNQIFIQSSASEEEILVALRREL